MKKMLILGPEEIQKLVRDKVRNPDSGAPETYLIVSWDIAE
jgi:hypothetical protein